MKFLLYSLIIFSDKSLVSSNLDSIFANTFNFLQSKDIVVCIADNRVVFFSSGEPFNDSILSSVSSLIYLLLNKSWDTFTGLIRHCDISSIKLWRVSSFTKEQTHIH